MKNNLLISLLITLIFSVNFLHAQVSINGTPPSFNDQNLQSIKVPTENMQAIDVNALKAEDIINDQEKGQIWRFGENILYDINPQDNGVWDILPNGDKVWRVNIESSGALTINLTFDKYNLPPGAELYIYNEDHSEIIGAFTDYNNQADGFFATTLVQGEIITVEYYEPSNVPFAGEINIYRVTHGYRGPGEYAAKAFGSSGSCNVNVVCPLATGWEEEIRSTVMFSKRW
jgi:lysyl endopeptidase